MTGRVDVVQGEDNEVSVGKAVGSDSRAIVAVGAESVTLGRDGVLKLIRLMSEAVGINLEVAP